MGPDLQGKTAVITGGASGMGLAMANRFGSAGCNVVIADIEEPTIDACVSDLEAAGVPVLGVATDVSDEDSMDALESVVADRFGDAHIVCLNAGVVSSGATSELSTADWAWVLGVNLWGVIHGLRVFLPGLEARNEGHVVITASVAGILSYPSMGPYNASKHAVLTMAETLHHELREKDLSVNVSALCPGLVRTRILDSDRNRPEKYQPVGLELPDEPEAGRAAVFREMLAKALDPAEVADMVHDAVVDGTFYIFTDAEFAGAVARRHRQVEGGVEPTMESHLLGEHMDSQATS